MNTDPTFDENFIPHAVLYSSDKSRCIDLAELLRSVGATVEVVSETNTAKHLLVDGKHNLFISDVSGFDSHGINMLHWYNHHQIAAKVKSLGIITPVTDIIPKFTYSINYDNRFSAGDTTFDNMSSVLFSLYAANSPVSWLKKASDAYHKAKSELEQNGPKSKVVLLLGEIGVGKESFAQIAHQTGGRKDCRFVHVECKLNGDIPFLRMSFNPDEVKSIERNIRNLFADADGGTLYFHGVDNLPPDVQNILAKVIESNTYIEPGTGKRKRFSGLTILSADGDLCRAIVRGRFSQKLFDTISPVTIRIPALSECKSDIIPLAESFLTHFCISESLPMLSLSNESKKKLTSHVWTGNVRELYSVITRAAMHSNRKKIQPSDINLIDYSDESERPASKRARVKKALRDAGGKKAKAARRLGVTRKTLYRWMADLKISLDYPNKTEAAKPKE